MALNVEDYFTPGWCDDGTCFYHYGVYNSSHTEETFYANIESNGFCYVGELFGARKYPLNLSIYLPGGEFTPPPTPTFADFQALSTTVGDIRYRYSSPYWFRIVDEGYQIGERLVSDDWNNSCSTTVTTTGAISSYYIGSDTWLYTTTVYINERVKIYKDVNLFSCPLNSTLINGECVPDDGYIWDEIIGEFVSSCERKRCLYLPEVPTVDICRGEYGGVISLEPNTDTSCEMFLPTTIYFTYRETYTDGIQSSSQRFKYIGPKSIEIDTSIGNAKFEIKNIDANGRCGTIEVIATSTNEKYYQCQTTKINICCDENIYYDGGEASTCCDHVPKDYKLWVPTNECSRFEQKKHITALPSKMKVK